MDESCSKLKIVEPSAKWNPQIVEPSAKWNPQLSGNIRQMEHEE